MSAIPARRNLHRHTFDLRYLPALWLGSFLCVVLLGCGATQSAAEIPVQHRPLAFGNRSGPLAAAELVRARRAARAFAASYLAATRHHGEPAVHAASPALRRSLEALARSAPAKPQPPTRLRALSLTPRSATRADVTLWLTAAGAPPFPVAFVIASIGGRWMAVRLPGN